MAPSATAHAAQPLQPPSPPLRSALAAHIHILSQDIGPRHTGAPKAYALAARYIIETLSKAHIRIQAIPMPPAAHCPPILVARFGPGNAAASASPTRPDATPVAPPRTTPSVRLNAAPGSTPNAMSDATPEAAPDAPSTPAPDLVPAPDAVPDTLPAAAHQGATLLLCAHYDSVPGSPGAGDNASGVAVLLETARALARHAPPATVDVAFFPNEEEPHFMTATSGSAHYAALLASRRALPALAVAVDTVGWPASGPIAPVRVPPALRIAATDLVVGARSPARAQASALASSLGCDPMTTDVGAIWLDRSDHAAFAAHGVPAALVAAWAGLFSPLIHSPQDTSQSLDFTLLENVVLGLMDFTSRLGTPRPSGDTSASEPPPPPAAAQGEQP